MLPAARGHLYRQVCQTGRLTDLRPANQGAILNGFRSCDGRSVHACNSWARLPTSQQIVLDTQPFSERFSASFVTSDGAKVPELSLDLLRPASDIVRKQWGIWNEV